MLSFSKIQDMENRLAELRRNQQQTDKQLNMLENIKKKQLHCIDDHNTKEASSMEQVNLYKDEFRKLTL